VYAYRVDLPDIASPEGESSALAMSVTRKKMMHIYIIGRSRLNCTGTLSRRC